MDAQEPMAPQELDEWFLSLLACPGCVQRHSLTLVPDGSGLLCACGKYRFPVTDGIPVLLVDSAEVLNADADPTTVGSDRGGSTEV